jgi:hypothetical protein
MVVVVLSKKKRLQGITPKNHLIPQFLEKLKKGTRKQ